MRLAGYVAVELSIAAALLAGAVAGGTFAVLKLRHVTGSHGGRGEEPLAARDELSDLGDLRVALESSGTFLGMSDELLLERVRTQPIKRFKLNHGGSSISFRIDFEDGSRAAWKPQQTNSQTIPRKEVAAYRLNRLLGLNAVPPAAPRAVSRDELFSHLHPESLEFVPRMQAEIIFGPDGKSLGTASYWIPIIKDSGFDTPEGQRMTTAWLTHGEPIPADKLSMARQVSDLCVFDFLTANPDRFSGGNMKMAPDGTELFYMDNTMSFFLDPTGPPKNRDVFFRTQRFSRSLVEALNRISDATLRRALSAAAGGPHELLTPPEITALLGRRDVVKRHIDGLIAKYGAREVLYFP